MAVSGVAKIMRHPKSTHANPTPATNGKHLVVFFGSEGLFTYNLHGRLLWKQLWRTPRNDVPTFGSPAVAPYTAGGAQGWQVVVNGWKHIGGYDLETGKELVDP
ncbi:MAG: hypothetical protein ACLP59_21495 [Bryobacteraceae bacterium]